MEEMERLSLYAELTMGGKQVSILACRHFMYYGKSGSCFQALKTNLQKIFKENERSL